MPQASDEGIKPSRCGETDHICMAPAGTTLPAVSIGSVDSGVSLDKIIQVALSLAFLREWEGSFSQLLQGEEGMRQHMSGTILF